jgi:hypothetical protein
MRNWLYGHFIRHLTWVTQTRQHNRKNINKQYIEKIRSGSIASGAVFSRSDIDPFFLEILSLINRETTIRGIKNAGNHTHQSSLILLRYSDMGMVLNQTTSKSLRVVNPDKFQNYSCIQHYPN